MKIGDVVSEYSEWNSSDDKQLLNRDRHVSHSLYDEPILDLLFTSIITTQIVSTFSLNLISTESVDSPKS